MFHVGLDIHTTRISIRVLDRAGQVTDRSQVRGIEDVLRVLRGLPNRSEVWYEASCGYGHDHDLLRPLATPGLVARPGQLQLTFRSKRMNDRNDAERLAKLLYMGETPTVHVPSLEVRTWRELVNCRSRSWPGGRGPRTSSGRCRGVSASAHRSTPDCGRRRA